LNFEKQDFDEAGQELTELLARLAPATDDLVAEGWDSRAEQQELLEKAGLLV